MPRFFLVSRNIIPMKKLPLILLSLLVMTGCKEATDTKEQTAGNATAVVQTDNNSIPAQAQLDDAKSKGKVAFLVLVSNDTAGNAQALEIAGNTTLHAGNSVVIKANRDDSANAALIEKWHLSSIPTPAIFIISPKGIPVTSFSLEEATIQDMINDIPSPKMDDAYVALDEQKAVFILVARSNAPGREKLATNVGSAIAQLKAKATLVEVDPDDSKEQSLLKNFGIEKDATEPTLVVLNAEGDRTGAFHASATVNELVTAATKVVKTPCCASGEPCK